MNSYLRALSVLLIAAGSASAQYSQDFNGLNGSAGGTVLTGQDGFYIPDGTDSVDFDVYTYDGNTMGLPQNPDGGTQFAGGIGPGAPGGVNTFARAQRDLPYGDGTGVWTATFDIAATYMGQLPAVQNLGSLSTQVFPDEATFIALARWNDLNTADSWNADYVWFDAAGTQLIEEVGDPGFLGLDAERWYRWSTTFDLDTNLILEVSIMDIISGDVSTNNPVDRYLFGGAAGAPSPTGLRLFAGGSGQDGNALGFDNLSITPEPTTLALLALGGVALIRRRR